MPTRYYYPQSNGSGKAAYSLSYVSCWTIRFLCPTTDDTAVERHPAPAHWCGHTSPTAATDNVAWIGLRASATISAPTPDSDIRLKRSIAMPRRIICWQQETPGAGTDNCRPYDMQFADR
ncbi:MAG: hypothetical protein ACLVK0_13775 [Parabacteroides merdae]